MNYWGIIGGTLSIGALSIWYYQEIIKEKISNYLLKQVMQKLDNDKDNEDQNEIPFTPLRRTKSAIVKFKHGGETHSIYIPYDRTKMTESIGKRLFLIKNNERTDITHKPGIPYFLSASNMGGDKIILIDDTGKTIKEFEKNEIPTI